MQDYILFVTNHWLISAALLLIILAIIMNEIYTARQKTKEVSPQEAVNLINHENAVVIDIRKQDNYGSGHIIDAVNIAADALLENKKHKLNKKTLIIVCNRGVSALTVADKLINSKKFSDVYVLAGGMQAWNAASLPIVKE